MKVRASVTCWSNVLELDSSIFSCMLQASEIWTPPKLIIQGAFTPGTFCFALFETNHLFRISSYVPLGSLCGPKHTTLKSFPYALTFTDTCVLLCVAGNQVQVKCLSGIWADMCLTPLTKTVLVINMLDLFATSKTWKKRLLKTQSFRTTIHQMTRSQESATTPTTLIILLQLKKICLCLWNCF